MAKKKKKTIQTARAAMTDREQRAIWDSARINLYLGIPQRDKLLDTADQLTRIRGSRISASELVRRMIENLSEKDLRRLFPDLQWR